jgi:adenylate cyclase
MSAQKVLRFGRFTLDPNTASLCGGDRQLPLRPKSFDVLLYLTRHPARIVSKDELIQAVWPNIFVTDNSLVQCISDIRVALDDEAQSVLKTVARRGYLFAAPVIEVDPSQHLLENARIEDDSTNGSPAHAPAGPVAQSGPWSWRRHPAALVSIGLLVFAIVAGAAAIAWREGQRGVDATLPASVAGGGVESAASQRRASIAVLPLVTLGASAADEYFADGLTEDIIAALGRFSELSVISPRAVFPYKGKAVRPEDIGRELKVRYIAEGSLRRSPERVRLAMRLTDASLGTLLWADQYDAEPDSIFAIQDSITRQITGALAVRLGNVEQARVAAKPPSSLEAYDLVLRGRDLLSRLTRSATSNARVMFERAVELDPNYAAAYVGLGRVDLTAVALGWTPDPAGALHRAESLARKSIGIDEFNPAAHVLLGRTYARLGEYDRALDELKRAIALNPSNPDSYAGLGDALLWSGDIEAAIKALETAAQLDPRLSTEDLFNLGAAYFLAGNDTDAVRTFERTVARNDSTAFIHAMLAAVYAEAGRKDESDRAAAELRRRNPFFEVATFGSLFRNPQHRQKIVSALQKAGF